MFKGPARFDYGKWLLVFVAFLAGSLMQADFDLGLWTNDVKESTLQNEAELSQQREEDIVSQINTAMDGKIERLVSMVSSHQELKLPDDATKLLDEIHEHVHEMSTSITAALEGGVGQPALPSPDVNVEGLKAEHTKALVDLEKKVREETIKKFIEVKAALAEETEKEDKKEKQESKKDKKDSAAKDSKPQRDADGLLDYHDFVITNQKDIDKWRPYPRCHDLHCDNAEYKMPPNYEDIIEAVSPPLDDIPKLSDLIAAAPDNPEISSCLTGDQVRPKKLNWYTDADWYTGWNTFHRGFSQSNLDESDTWKDNFLIQRVDMTKAYETVKQPLYGFLGNRKYCDMLDRFTSGHTEQNCKIMYAHEEWQCDPDKGMEKGSWTEMTEEEASAWIPEATIYPRRKHNKMLHVVAVKNSFSTPVHGHPITCDEILVGRATCHAEDHIEKYVQAMPHGNGSRFGTSGARRVKKMFSINNSWGYYHWINEALPRLAFYLDQLLEDPEIYIHVCCGVEHTYIRDYLAFLGIENDRVLSGDRVIAEQSWFPQGTPCVCNRWLPMLKLAQEFRKRIPDDIKEDRRLIVVLKRTCERRCIANWDAMYAALEKKFPDDEFFVHSQDSELTPETTVYTYARAKMIIGAFGAGLSNMIFAAPGTPILEIGNSGKGPHYLIQAGSLGFRYYAYMCDHWKVDPDHFAEMAHFMLNDKPP